MSQLLADSAATLLRGIPRLERAVVMPALIVGDQRTISSLREGAARLQVDLLLVYRPSCRLYERTPFIGTTVWRSVCTLEAAVLDTRSGVLPFSTVVTAEQVTQREHGEFEDAEAQRRGELSATLLALRGLVDRLGAQLALIPVRSESARPN